MLKQFEIPYRQTLNSEGQVLTTFPKHMGNAEMIKMYRHMTLTRVFDKKAVNLQRTGKLGTYASCLGHEATHTAIGAAMRPEDCFAPMYREYAAQLWRGVLMEDILRYWGGDERGNDFSGPAHDFAWCVPIATQCMYGAGAALAFKLREESRCVVTVVGDGGTSEGVFYEALNLAGAQKLPIVFVIVNNGWAISVSREAQTAAETLAQKAIAAGLPGVQVDGNDVVAMRDEIEKALTKARQGFGATVIEAITYRLSDHTTADDASRYRDNEQVEKAWAIEPLIRVRHFLTSQNIWSDKDEDNLIKECQKQVDDAVTRYLATPDAPVDDMFIHMYKNMPDSLLEQMEVAKHYATPSKH